MHSKDYEIEIAGKTAALQNAAIALAKIAPGDWEWESVSRRLAESAVRYSRLLRNRDRAMQRRGAK